MYSCSEFLLRDIPDEIICLHIFEDMLRYLRLTLELPPGVTDEDLAKAVFETLGFAVIAGLLVPTLATAGLTAAGFTGAGIAGGSIAAGVQAGIGNVAAGSLFATFQSIGATGGFAILGPVGFAAGAIAGSGYLGFKGYKFAKKVIFIKKYKAMVKEIYEASVRKPGEKVYVGGNTCESCWRKMQRLRKIYN